MRAQILVGLALVTLFAVLSTGSLALWAAGTTLQAQREASALSLVSSAAAAVAAGLDGDRPISAPENRARLHAMLRLLSDKGEVTQVSITEPGGRIVSSRPPRLPEDGDSPILVAALSGTPPAFNYRLGPHGHMELLAYAPITDLRDRVMGAVRVTVPAPTPVVSVLNRSGWLVAGLAVADALLVLGLGFFVLTQLVVRPLRDMQKATARVSAGDWEQQIAPSGPQEIAALASAFNQMTSSLAAQREQLIRTEKLASVGQLAAGVAHEIGNPLAAVLGYVDILRLDADPARGGKTPPPLSLPAADRLDTLNRIKAETQRIHRIIQDLLEYSRPSREEAQPTNPTVVLENARTLLVPQARFRGVKVNVDMVAPSRWPQVMVSPGRLTQVFVNLLLNAADAMGGAGVIDVSCAVAAGRVHITITDAGPGISADLRRKIFDPFFTTKPPGQGTGLGLPICRSIVESYGGTLELAPAGAAGTGATFVVSLPQAG